MARRRETAISERETWTTSGRKRARASTRSLVTRRSTEHRDGGCFFFASGVSLQSILPPPPAPEEKGVRPDGSVDRPAGEATWRA